MRVEQVAIPMIRQMVKHPKLLTALTLFDKWGNQFGPERASYPYPLYERMRAEHPVAHHRLYQQWFVTGHDQALEILASPKFQVSGQIETLLLVRPYSKLSQQGKDFFANLLVFQDPPDHTRLRRLVSRAFTPKQVARLEEPISSLAQEMVDAVRQDDAPELFGALTSPLPINVICELLGIPEHRWGWTHRITTSIVRLLDPFGGFDAAELSADIAELYDYFIDLSDERRKNPKEDLITGLAQANDDDDRFSNDELVAMIAVLMAAGHETTTGLLGNAIVALAKYPKQRDLIREQPELWPNAIEELIRYDTSVQMDPRMAVEDVEVGGSSIKAGENVLLVLGAANRDPERYDNPNELRLDRSDPRPISFGHGIHHCIGAALARMEMRIGLQTVLDTFGDYTIDPAAIEWKTSSTLRGPIVLPIKPDR